MKIDQRTFEGVRIRTNIDIPPSVLANTKIVAQQEVYNRNIGGLCNHIETIMLGNFEEEVKYQKVPLTWWDMFKETHFPSWLLRKYRVKYKWIAVECKYYKVCPHHNIDFEKSREVHLEFIGGIR